MAKWIDSSGGPLLLLPRQLVQEWSGIDPPRRRVVEAKSRWNPDGPATDYDRACDVEGYVGKIDVGAGEGLVLGDMPMPTAFIPSHSGGVLIRWMHAESEEDLLKAVRALNPIPESQESVRLQWSEGALVLFDSASPGAEVGEDCLHIDLRPGKYAADSVVVELDERTSAVLVTLARQVETAV